MSPRSLLTCSLLAFCSAGFADNASPRHDYPTQARVEFVLGCMNLHGGQNYDTLYKCVCSLDRIAEEMDYDEYVQAEMLGYLLTTPGERGGVFRDATPDSRDRARVFTTVRLEAEAQCLLDPK